MRDASHLGAHRSRANSARCSVLDIALDARHDQGIGRGQGGYKPFDARGEVRIEVNEAQGEPVDTVVSDHSMLALGQGGGPSDNRNAAIMSQFHDQQLNTLNNESLVSFYETVVANVAQSTASETTIAEGLDGYKQSLLSQRQQFSGVSLDEEAVQLLEFQHAFQAAARLISTADELFTILLNI